MEQILSEWYLLSGYSLAYLGAIMLLFFGTKGVFNAFWAFILFSIGYFAVSILRKTIFPESTESIIPKPE